MKVTEAKFNRRYKVADYEHEDYTLTAVLEDSDVPVNVLAILKADVAAAFGGEGDPASSIARAVPNEVVKEKKDKKAPKKEKEPEPEAEEEEEENDDEDPVDPEETEEEEEEEEEEEAPAKPSKKFKKKPQTYSRANESHKEIFSKTLLSLAPDWKKTAESKEKAKTTSQDLEGEEFLDESGEVLDSFKDAIKKAMSGKKKK